MKSSYKPGLPPSPKRTRRQFLSAGIRLAVASTVTRLDPARFAHAAGSDILRIGLIGAGGRGSGEVANLLDSSKQGEIELFAVADIFEDRLTTSLTFLANKKPLSVNVPLERRFIGFEAYQNVLQSEVDIVILATPPGFRSLHFNAAVVAGKHCHLETPLAVDMVSLRKILLTCAMAQEKKLTTVVDLPQRSQKSYRQTVAKLREGAIGRIGRMEAHLHGGIPSPKKRAELNKTYKREIAELEFQLRNWHEFAWLSGTLAVDPFMRNIDVCLWAKGETPLKVRAVGEKRQEVGNEYGDSFDFVHAEYDFTDGSSLIAETTCNSKDMPREFSETLIGDKGTAHLDLFEATIVDRGGTQISKFRKDWTSSVGDPDNPYLVQANELVKAIRKNVPLNNVAAAADSNIACIMARIAAATGKEVTWDEALNSNDTLFIAPTSWESPAPAQLDKFGNYTFPPRSRGG